MRQDVVVFITDGQKILLAMKKRKIGAGKWNGPGGKVEVGETPEQAMVRECQEEVGITPTAYQKVGELELHEFHESEAHHIFAHVYLCSSWEGSPTETDEMAPSWFNTDQIPYDRMWADDPYWLPQVLAGKKIKAIFKLDQSDKVVDYEVKEVRGF